MNQSTYRPLEEIELKELEKHLLSLREAGISPSDLSAFAHAMDVLDYHEEARSEEEDFSVEDALAASSDAAYEDCRGDVLDLYAGVRLCLEKMGVL